MTVFVLKPTYHITKPNHATPGKNIQLVMLLFGGLSICFCILGVYNAYRVFVKNNRTFPLLASTIPVACLMTAIAAFVAGGTASSLGIEWMEETGVITDVTRANTITVQLPDGRVVEDIPIQHMAHKGSSITLYRASQPLVQMETRYSSMEGSLLILLLGVLLCILAIISGYLNKKKKMSTTTVETVPITTTTQQPSVPVTTTNTPAVVSNIQTA